MYLLLLRFFQPSKGLSKYLRDMFLHNPLLSMCRRWEGGRKGGEGRGGEGTEAKERRGEERIKVG